MTTSKKVNHLPKAIGLVMAFAIFFSILPFSFGNVSWDGKEGVQWLWADYPEGAILIGLFGLLCWVGYFFVRRHLRTIAV